MFCSHCKFPFQWEGQKYHWCLHSSTPSGRNEICKQFEQSEGNALCFHSPFNEPFSIFIGIQQVYHKSLRLVTQLKHVYIGKYLLISNQFEFISAFSIKVARFLLQIPFEYFSKIMVETDQQFATINILDNLGGAQLVILERKTALKKKA